MSAASEAYFQYVDEIGRCATTEEEHSDGTTHGGCAPAPSRRLAGGSLVPSKRGGQAFAAAVPQEDRRALHVIRTRGRARACSDGHTADAGAHRRPSPDSYTAEAKAWTEQVQAHALAIVTDRERTSARAATEDEAARQQLARSRAALIEELERYNTRQLRRLGPALLDELIDLLADD